MVMESITVLKFGIKDKGFDIIPIITFTTLPNFFLNFYLLSLRQNNKTIIILSYGN